jgi:hypothetical protein
MSWHSWPTVGYWPVGRKALVCKICKETYSSISYMAETNKNPRKTSIPFIYVV